MIRLSRKTMLAIEAVTDVAYNARPNPVQARDITERQGIPQRYLEQVMQQLVRAGVLKGVRGPRGGYTLARERRRVTMGDVVRVVAALEAEGDEEVAGGELGSKVVAPLWEELQGDLLSRLDAVTMEDLCREAAARGVRRADEARADFEI
ncbi:RrF2 family transcriptional regulator [Rhodovulum sp. DZ06]|uniref:RrF2 family transcriptional regulator n=1 Tax=Rhodovulum sp. DZ06 TaxID=3425126 RepID=UPI003D34EA69